MQKVLIIAEQSVHTDHLSLELHEEGYEVTTVHSGKAGLQKLWSVPDWDIILLEKWLPEMSGIEMLRKIRLYNEVTPIVFLSDITSVSDCVSALDLGANEYLSKPFATEELLARMRNLLRFSRKLQSSDFNFTLQARDLDMNVKTRVVSRADRKMELTPTEFNLLRYFMEHPNEVLTREQIIAEVWGYDFLGNTNVVDVYIRYLRQKIDKGFQDKFIQTIRGIGYKFKVN